MSHTSKAPTILTIMKQAFEIKNNPYPWTKAISAGFCSAIPALIGLVTGNLAYGLQAGIGGFTYLYVFNEPYAQRAKKLFFVLIGMTLSVGLGTLFAPYPFISALIMGLIGAIGTFIFGALQIPGPAAVFFVLGFAMTAGMPVDPGLAPLRAGLVLLGGILSWLIGMAGWYFRPHSPEIAAVKKSYFALASLLESIGKEQFDQERHRTVTQLSDTEDILLAGYISWQSSDLYKRLILLNEHASHILLDIIEAYEEESEELPPELAASVRAVANAIDHKMSTPLEIRQPEDSNELVNRLFTKIYNADAIMNEPVTRIEHDIKISSPALSKVFGGAFDKNSVVFLSAIRYGVILIIAALVAYLFGFYRSYWIPLSCAAVMLGSTVVSTFLRAIQRTIGTIVGIITASVILYFQPEGIFIVIFILIFTTITELFIVRNYALAAMFITPNALLIAESTTQINNISLFTTARITDVIIGSCIGLIGTLLAGRKSASSRLPHTIAKTLRSQVQFLQLLFANQKNGYQTGENSAQNKMHINLKNLKILYTTALGEIPSNRKELGFLWPVIFSIEQLGYHLDSIFKNEECPRLPDKDLAQFLLVFETMANVIEYHQAPVQKNVPGMKEYPKMQKEIVDLQEALFVCRRT